MGKRFKVDNDDDEEKEKVVKLISITPDSEKLIAYCARVSSNQQDNPSISKLLRYCIKHKHWSIFETAYLTVEINTSRAISAQILRHRSFTFQEFSQRYAEVPDFVTYEARRQDKKNRQASIDDMSIEDKHWFSVAQDRVQTLTASLYLDALDKGIAKEQARFLLPMSSKTKIYMTGNIRSWIHYLELRTGIETQKEHRDLARQVKEIYKEELPIISGALEW